jgi:hypothetical protein
MSIKYAGYEWVVGMLGVELSPLGKDVADILGQAFLGIYHIEKSARKTDWTNKQYIVIAIRTNLSTVDTDILTRLVVLCHDRAIRMDISSRAFGVLELMFHRRRRSGGIMHRHPTIEQAIEAIRGLIGLNIVRED